ncbi:MAG: pyrimidine 5'-nucleotidase [Rhodospirillaceae bacterium]|jgi:putative hydrolase of the HAD superfamily|nr:pyrimidine 5'-nucleotidase [Rhodospirillaceae bacterium]MBT4588449.1 pyrimidine 5'-nucleotidase [Rhodospirillaceae bacterium]MBT4937964.1 pyrimidine 5'-nucleotidase [Rhodospirillaceae bacterium]MBT5939293.1 pyrimidine 5'-nucleotidase [Rhodospirillaceae bacterium]MBT7265539.1 pyrimidine 5'-nucleotidase [Rhodospirillaceae bacterium]
MSKHPSELRDIETWIFDLDNTLYHVSANLFDQIDRRMCNYVAEFLNIPAAEAYKVQKSFFREHGTTLRGMMECHDMDPGPYLDYVHEIDFSPIETDEVMAKALAALPGRKIVFTNAATDYALKVIERLGVDHHMEDVFDIVDAGYIPKPAPEVYTQFVEKYDIEPSRAVMVEDMARNLIPAAALGMKTVWVQTDRPWAHSDEEAAEPDFTTDSLSDWLAEVVGS